MRPHRLRVQAFGAFAGQEQVVFDDLEGLFLLHGETGAGKTTLLDAIAFALYGRVPGERGTARRLRSDHAAPGTPTEVELEATIGGRHLRVTRKPEQERPKRSGKGFTREQASVRLDERTAAGTWENKSTRVAEADKEIAALMGMSAEQFFQVVLLPQGRFAQFLHASAADKEALLQKLFGTDRFRRVEAWLAERRRATDKEVAAASEAVNRLVAQVAQAAGVPVPETAPAGPDAQATGLPEPAGPWQAAWSAGLARTAAGTADDAAAAAAAVGKDLKTALAARVAAEQLQDRQRRREDADRRRRELDADAPAIALLRAEAEAAASAAEVAPVLDESKRAAVAAGDAQVAEESARMRLPDADGLRTAAADVLHAVGQEQQAQVGRLEALRAVARQAEEEDEIAAAAGTRAARLAEDLASAEAEVARRHSARPQAEQARDAASRAASALPAAQDEAGAAHRIATDSAALVKEHAKRVKLHEAHVTAREKAAGARETAVGIRQARIDGMRAELAADMTDGSPCPVCGSLDHPEPVDSTSFPPVSRDVEVAAVAKADEAAAAAEKAGSKVAAVDAVIDELARRLFAGGFVLEPGDGEAAGEAVDEAAGEGRAASPLTRVLAAGPGALAAAASAASAAAERLEGVAGTLRDAAASRDGAQRELDELESAIADGKSRITELTGLRTAALAEADAAAGRAADRRAELRAQLAGAPDLEAAITAAARLAEALTGAADAADKTARTEAEARRASERAAAAAIEAGFAPGDAGDAAGADEAVARAAADAAAAAARDQRWRREAAERIKRHEAETEAVATLLADPDLAGVALEVPAPVAEAAAAAEEAQRAYDDANKAQATAQHTAAQLAGLLPRLDEALAAVRPLKDRAEEARRLADLAAGLGANQYKMTLSSFVLAARLEEVAAAASERLLTMTAGRYCLVHSDARKGNAKAGLSLLACDAWTGIDRDTATLSGGETFLASLALALGLADVVTAESAGTPMEALFVDEGFGTLDEETLDEVMNVLDDLRAGGRIVGIVSHVTELRQRIPAQVHVRKGRAGSHVAVTAG